MSAPEFLTVAEVVKLLRFDVTAPRSAETACRQFLARHAIPVRRRGRTLLVERAVLLAALEATT